MYKTVAGDTFDLVSRKVYGEQSGASRIAAANPGAAEPFTAGVPLVIPEKSGAIVITPSSNTTDRDEVTLFIDDLAVKFFTSITLRRQLDAVDTFHVTAPFDPDRATLRESFEPFKYQPIDINIGDKRLFSGTMMNVTPHLRADQRVVSASGYSLPGVLGDCTMPAGAFPIDFFDVNLEQIARKMVEPFGIDVQFQEPSGAPFEDVAALPENRVMVFLARLARQRNLVIGSDEFGSLVFRRELEGLSQVATFVEGEQPLLSVSAQFTPQQMFSHVSGIEPVSILSAEEPVTVKNPHLDVVRPLNVMFGDAIGGELLTATNAKAGRMFASGVNYTVDVPGWRNAIDTVWEPGQLVSLHAPGAMIYNPYQFVIRTVEFNIAEGVKTTSLILMIPGSFSGRIPETVPWAF